MTFTIPLQIIDLNEDGYHPLLDIKLYGNTFKAVLDTGASKTAFDQSMLMMVNAEANIIASDRLSTGLGTNTMVSSTVVLPDFYIGDLHVPAFEVAVLDLSAINIAYEQLNHPQVLGVVGGDILMAYKAIIDYEKRVLKLKARKRRSRKQN